MKSCLRIWRMRRAVTQKQLSDCSGVGTATISRIERGYEAHPATIGKLAKALHIDPTELIAR